MAKHMQRFKQVAMLIAGGLIAISLLLYVINQPAPIDLFLIIATIFTGIPILYYALQALRLKLMSIDLLVAIAMIGALFIGEYVESSVVGFLFLFGSYLESRTLAKTRSSIQALLDIAPEVAVVLKDQQEVTVPINEVEKGDIIVVKSGGKVPVDGEVTAGDALMNEAMMTGESIPVDKVIGDNVFSGTMVDQGYIRVKATKVGAATAFSQIIELVEEAQDQKSKTERFLDRFSQFYTPAVVVLALVVYLVTRNIHLSITFLVIACPGALVIGAPVSNVSGIGNGAKNGVLLKGGDVIDRFNKARTFVFDKTGTLTKGKPKVVALKSIGDTTDWLKAVAELEHQSEHHLARAIVEKAEQTYTLETETLDVEIIKGQGLTGINKDERYLIGNRRLLEQNAVTLPEALEAQAVEAEGNGQTVIFVVKEAIVLGFIVIADEIRPEAKQALFALKQLGAEHLVMLTGDNKKTANFVAKSLGIADVRAELSPKDKLTAIRDLQEAGESVVMVGDGVNDAPALALSDIGVAMGLSGTDVAIETADVVAMNDRLDQLVHAFRLSKQTVRNRTENIIIALLTVFFLLIGVLNGKIHLASGMFVHEASVLIVILNGMRLLKYKPRR